MAKTKQLSGKLSVGRFRRSPIGEGVILTSTPDEDLNKVEYLEPTLKHDGYPSFFGQAARAAWNDIVRNFEAVDGLNVLDIPLLIIYCNCWQEYIDITTELTDDPRLRFSISLTSGNESPSPRTKLKQAALDNMLKIAAKFGFNPYSRKLIGQSEDDDEDDEFSKNYD